MENYKCAYRDLNSPLTPIPPMADNAFDFSQAATALLSSTNRGDFRTPTNLLNVSKAVNCNFKRTPSPGSETKYFYSSKTKITVNKINCNPRAGNSVTSVQEMVHCNMGNGTSYKASYKEIDERQETYEQRKVCYKSVSPPHAPQPLCRKMEAVLHDLGLASFKPLFQKEEIDFAAFMLLDERDLDALGIYRRKDRYLLLNTIDFYNECQEGY